MPSHPTDFAIPVKSDDPKQKDKEEGSSKLPKGKDKKKDGENDDTTEYLARSKEDQQLKNELEMLAERLKPQQEFNADLYRPALETLRTLIGSSTSSMTSAPKPPKFLHPLYPICRRCETWPASVNKAFTIYGDPVGVGHDLFGHTTTQERCGIDCSLRRYGQRAHRSPTRGSWGHEYVRHLAAELGDEYNIREREEEEDDQGAAAVPKVPGTIDDLRALAKQCAAFLLDHNAEPDAIDPLQELEMVEESVALVDKHTHICVCQYLLGCLRPPSENPDEAVDIEELLSEDIRECLSNSRLSGHLREFGKELGVSDPKSLEEVYKTHLENTRPNALANVDSARGNLAGTFVNAFVNAGYGNDKLMVEAEEGNSWVYKNKDHGMMSAAASLGVSLLWDTDVGLSHIDNGIRTEADLAKGLIAEYVDNKSNLLELLIPHISDDVTMEIAGLAALSLGFIFVSSENGEITGTILQVLMEKAERADKSLDEKWARFMALGLGLLYLGLQDASDTTIETLKAIDHPIAKTAQVIVEACAFAGTGNVLKIQAMLHYCDEHIVEKKEEKKDEKKDDAAAAPPAAGAGANAAAPAPAATDASTTTPKEGETREEPKKQDDTFQSFAVLAVSLISMGEEIGAEMALRQFHHLMHYGEPVIRKAVPLAIGLNSVSNPQLPILDTLSKYSHDNDLAVALNAIFAMGLLAGYYYKEPDCLFMVRVAQGLVHMGKGTMNNA
ncbi:26S proteasome regulatory subunit RPN1 [Mycena chlorophos]|uniref:26S proteasome regulatory subunit RPN1 n=1 Tax=Mycena chlorophos TaxID=658473 RepID=A0A8H6SHR7_MYCCL|nr:26S proteasome regulatory subunit RPN1 [Mycena chlorophos]